MNRNETYCQNIFQYQFTHFAAWYNQLSPYDSRDHVLVLNNQNLGRQIYVSNYNIITSYVGLLPVPHQTVISNAAGLLSLDSGKKCRWHLNIIQFSHRKCLWKCRLQSCGHYIPNLICWTGQTDDVGPMGSITLNASWSPCCWHGLTLIPAWMSNYLYYNVWGEIVYPIPNFNGATIEVWK